MALIIILSVAGLLCVVVMVLGCLNCFMKKKPGFAPFSNPGFVEEGSGGRHNDAFTVDMEPTSPQSNESRVAIEPLPDIASSKPTQLPPLRPKFHAIDTGNEDTALSFLSSHRPFPRQHLTYLNPLGTGWFGQAITTEALRITTGSLKSQVVVKILKDEATKEEEKQFIEEILPFRHLDHANVMSLLGQCTEAKPYLVILENAAHGNLKSFLQSNKQHSDALLKKDKLLHFSLNVAAGMACVHRHNFVHCDLATRNCLVMADYTVKVGDYGLAEDLFKGDYLQTSRELLPIRWMAPECLAVDEENTLSSQNFGKTSDMWSFGVLLWEIFTFAEQPYSMLTDEAVIQGVILDRVVSLAEIPHKVPFHDELYALIKDCCRGVSERICIETAYQVLEDLSKGKVERVEDEMDFDKKWNHLLPKDPSRTHSMISEDGSLASGIALAGSFSSETPFQNNEEKQPSAIPTTGDVSEQPRLTPKSGSGLTSQAELPLNSQSAGSGPNLVSNVNGQTSAMKNDQPTILTLEQAEANTDPITDPFINNQMTTSTPRADKNDSSFATEPNTSSAPFVTAQESVESDNVFLNNSQILSTQDFVEMSSEGSRTQQDSEIKQVEAAAKDSTPVQTGVSEYDLNSRNVDGLTGKEDKKVAEGDISNMMIANESKLDEQSAKNVIHHHDDILYSSYSEKQDAGSEPFGSKQTGQSQTIDMSFDFLAPPLLSQDGSLSAVTQEPKDDLKISTSKPMDTDVFARSEESVLDNASSQITEANSLFEFHQENNESSMIMPKVENVVVDSSQSVHEVQSGQDPTSFNSLFSENDTATSSISLSSHNPFIVDDTSASSHDGFQQNQSNLDVSSSVNSIWGPTTSEPNPPAKEIDSHHDIGGFTGLENGQAEETSEKSSPISSDFSFLDVPVVSNAPNNLASDGNGDAAATFTNKSNIGSLPVDMTPMASTNQLDDLFGSSSAQQLSVGAADPDLSSLSATTTASSGDPFDVFGTISTTATNDIKPMEEAALQDVEHEDQKKSESSSFDLLGLDPFSTSSTTPAGSNVLDPILGDLASVSSPVTQVGSTGCTFDESCPNESGDESGVTCYSVTESPTVPTAMGLSDSCYVSVTELKHVESASEEISRGVFDASDDQISLSNLTESDCISPIPGDFGDDNDDADRDISGLKERLMGEELFVKLQEQQDMRRSPVNLVESNEDSNSTTGTASSTDSDSEREYVCVNPFDTGQPPTTNSSSSSGSEIDKENTDPDILSRNDDVAFDDLNEHDLKIVSELYLSKGVKSPRVFQIPALETIPENQLLNFVTMEETPNPTTPSETSSVGHRDEDLFSSDCYEWDDYYGDSLVGKESAVPELDISSSSPVGDQNISNWSVDFDADSHSQLSRSSNSSAGNTSLVSNLLLNRSEPAVTTGNKADKSSISDQSVHCLSDSEILVSKSSKTSSPRTSLVASVLSRHRNNSSHFLSPMKTSNRDKGNYYSLMEDFDFQLNSSLEDSNGLESFSDEDNESFVGVDSSKSFHPQFPALPSTSSPFSSASLPSSTLPQSNSLVVSPRKSAAELESGMSKQSPSKASSLLSDLETGSSLSPSSSASAPSSDLLGLGFVTASSEDTGNGTLLDFENSNSNSAKSQSTIVADDPFDFSFS